MKNFRLREYLVIIFLVLGIIAFVFERKFEPKYYTATAAAEGYTDDVNVTVTAYKKSNGDLRIVDIVFTHSDTEAIVNPALSDMVQSIYNRQDISKLDTIAGVTYSSQGFIDAIKIAVETIKNID